MRELGVRCANKKNKITESVIHRKSLDARLNLRPPKEHTNDGCHAASHLAEHSNSKVSSGYAIPVSSVAKKVGKSKLNDE